MPKPVRFYKIFGRVYGFYRFDPEQVKPKDIYK